MKRTSIEIVLIFRRISKKEKMTENRNKKKRIAHIGNMTCTQGTENLNCDEALEQADCNLVYNIMQSMDKSQNAMTYQQLEEFRSKEKVISRTNNAGKRNIKSHGSKQTKKFVPEKTFPLMAKCQKSMKYLKKNRCIPKPRAHVGSVLKLPQISSNFNPNHVYNNYNSSSGTLNQEKYSMKIKQYSKKKGCSSERNAKKKKSKTSSGSYCDKTFQTKYLEKEPKSIGEIDSDCEFEQFLQKHHPEKSSSSYYSDSSFNPLKSNKNKRNKRNKRKAYAAKITQITRKKLSDFEESNESEVESIKNNNTNITDKNCKANSRQCCPSKFQRIIEHQTSDDCASDAHLNDSGILNHDSFSSSEDENMVVNSSNQKLISIAPDLNAFRNLDVFSAELNSITLSTSLSEPKNDLNYDRLKSKCNEPCFVLLKRDPLLDQKAASLYTDNSLITNTVLDSNLYDDGDCIIISESSTINNNSQESGNIWKSTENRNSTIISKSSVSEALTIIDNTQNKCMLTEKVTYGANKLLPQTEKNPSVSNLESAKSLCGDSCMEVQMGAKEIFKRDTASIKSLSDSVKDKHLIVNEVTRHTDKNASSSQYEKCSSPVNSITPYILDIAKAETDDYLNKDSSTSSLEKDKFNVRILSVKSLNESDIIMLSDDDEGKGSETISATSVTKKSEAEDSDVEIICLDSSIDDKKNIVNENIKDVINNKICNRVDNGLKGNSSSSSSSAKPVIVDDEDCIILDDVDLQSEKQSSKNSDTMQQSSQINAISDGASSDEKMHSNKRGTISGNKVDSKNSILKILETIDFNCIKKVLNETARADINEVKHSDSISSKVENSVCYTQTSEKEKSSDLFPEKLKQSQIDKGLQKQTTRDINIAPVDSSEVKISSLKNSLVGTHEKQLELSQNSDVSHKIIKNDSENLGGPESNNTFCSSDNNNKSSFPNSNTILAVPKLSICDKELISSNLKTGQNAMLHSKKNQQLLPAYPKMENYECPSDELDTIAAKSIQNLDEHQKQSILPLLELYRTEYKKFMEIKCTEQNVTAGLKLLEEKQTKKLKVLSSSIKNYVKNDGCFHKVNNEFDSTENMHQSFIKSNLVKKDESSDEIKKAIEYKTESSNSNCSEIEKDDKVKIFHPSFVERTSKVLKSKSVGPSISQEVYNHLINSVCAECGKHAVAACFGCANIYYCSETCGLSHWNKGHYATCRR